MAIIQGTQGNDVNWSGTDQGDTMYGYGGSDIFYANAGDDLMFGGSGIDGLVGGEGSDTIYGGVDGDTLIGDEGVNPYFVGADWLYGGEGNDTLRGGGACDHLIGGTGTDTFQIGSGDSEPTSARADQIHDFNRVDDWIQLPTEGTADNFTSLNIGYNEGFDTAYAYASQDTGNELNYTFVTDGVNGYLFGDTVGDGAIDFGVVLAGLTSTDQLLYSDIIGV